SDPGASYVETLEIDISRLTPVVALPHLPENVKPVEEVGEIPIDQVVIGSCTNGRITDLRQAAQILNGRKVHPYVRLIVIPATQEIYRQAMKEGLFDIFLEAGAAVSTPTCGPCLGGHMGVLAEGERAVATTNRNFVGRMGHPKSEVYLSNPYVAAASAIAGRIVHPREVL
ncbi:MAG: 3-isopropylmalate dehydratase large subunit, partial [Aquificota bacterium]